MDMKLVGRIREQELLTDALTSHRSELVAIYGRRRIGKTTYAGLFMNFVASIYL
jgi:AAA+ ATPase superfamily predicted ATPase